MHIQTEFGDDRLDGEPLPAIDLGQVHTNHLIQSAAQIDGGFIALRFVPSSLAWRSGRFRAVDLGCKGRVLLRHLLVTGGALLMVKIGQCQGLRERKELFRPVVAG